MPANGLALFEPRKTPVQARAAVTVEAISEATIQVLLTHGSDRLTTTRVAERAGVSVGTLYQYYPNKQSLLFAVFEDHLNRVAVAVESVCKDAHHKPFAEMIRLVVEAYVNVKMDRADISIALYKVAPDIGGTELVKRVGQRSRKAIEEMLQTAPDIELPADKCHRHDALRYVGCNAFRPRGESISSYLPQNAGAPRAALSVLYGSPGSPIAGSGTILCFLITK